MPDYSVDYFHMNSERKINVVIQLLGSAGLVQIFNTLSLNLLPCVCFIRLGGETTCREWKGGNGIKNFEKHWLRLL